MAVIRPYNEVSLFGYLGEQIIRHNARIDARYANVV